MNRAAIILVLALVVAAVAPGRTELKATAAPAGQTAAATQQAGTMTEEASLPDGLYTVQGGDMDGFAYTLQFTQPDGQSGNLISGQAYPNQWNGAIIDRMSTAQSIEQAGTWDSVPEGTSLTLQTPGKDIAQVTVTLDPNTVYDLQTGQPETSKDVYAPQSIQMTPGEDGELHTCSFPISFRAPDSLQEYNQIFCIIEVTFRDGDSCDIGCALTRA